MSGADGGPGVSGSGAATVRLPAAVLVLPCEAGEGDRPEDGGGGGQFHRQPNDCIGHVIDLPGNIDRRNTHDRNSSLPKPRVLSSVALRAIGGIVAHPVDLDRQQGLGTVEVEHVWPNRMLAAKDRHARRASAQSGPQPRFRWRKIAAQAPCVGDGLLRRSHMSSLATLHHGMCITVETSALSWVAPSTVLRTVPLPRFAWEDGALDHSAAVACSRFGAP